MNKEVNTLVEQRLAEYERHRSSILEAWKPTVDKAEGFYKAETSKSWSDWTKKNLAIMLENTSLDARQRGMTKLFETTTGDAVSYLGVQLPVVLAIMPSLVLNEISVVQALDRRSGSVFFANITAGQAKGSVAAGATLVSAKTGMSTATDAKRFPLTRLTAEVLTSTSGTLAYASPVAGTLVITNGTETLTDNGDGTLSSDLSGGRTGTITTAGAWTITGALSGGGTMTAQYQYKFDKITTNGVPEIDLGMTSEAITAEDFVLRAKFSLAAAIDLQKAHGIDLEAYLSKSIGEYMKFSIDHYGIEQIVAAGTAAGAATSPGAFTATPGEGQEFVFRKYEFLRYINKGSNNIFKKTLRGMANYIVADNDTANLISLMGDDHFKKASDFGKNMPTGPMVIGQLDGRTVVQDPFLDAGTYTLGWKGDDIINAGFVYLPYIPLFSTQTLTTSDLISQKGFYSASGFKVVNSGLFTAGTVIGM